MNEERAGLVQRHGYSSRNRRQFPGLFSSSSRNADTISHPSRSTASQYTSTTYGSTASLLPPLKTEDERFPGKGHRLGGQ